MKLFYESHYAEESTRRKEKSTCSWLSHNLRELEKALNLFAFVQIYLHIILLIVMAYGAANIFSGFSVIREQRAWGGNSNTYDPFPPYPCVCL